MMNLSSQVTFKRDQSQATKFFSTVRTLPSDSETTVLVLVIKGSFDSPTVTLTAVDCAVGRAVGSAVETGGELLGRAVGSAVETDGGIEIGGGLGIPTIELEHCAMSPQHFPSVTGGLEPSRHTAQKAPAHEPT